jgi:DNA-directed RNA polymerase beta' subunit
MTMEAKFYRLSEKHQKTVAEHEKVMSDTLRTASENLKKLEDEISKKANLMKEAEERVRAEETKRSEAEAEVARLQERVGKLESECISRLNKAHQEGMREGEEKGMEEGLQKGKALGREGAMGEVATQFQLVYNSGFRLGWKSALYKTEHPETSELFLRTGTHSHSRMQDYKSLTMKEAKKEG